MPSRSQNPFIKSISNRSYVITPADAGLILNLGPATSGTTPGVWEIQFAPDLTFNGSVLVMGVLMGVASDQANAPFVPIPYRGVTLSNVAQDYTFTAAQIGGQTSSLIQVPANGIEVGLLVSNYTTGNCLVLSWDMNGPSSV